MTVENTQNKMPPLQMGTATEYPFTFAVLLQDPTEEEALKAIKANVLQADGTEIELVYGVDYTVNLNTDRIGGTVFVKDVRTSGDYLTIYREYTHTQEVDYQDLNAAPAETFEQCFDKLTMLSQQQQEAINRSLKLNVSSTTVSPTLPEPISNNTLIWDSEGASLKNYDIIGENDAFKKQVNDTLASGQQYIQDQFDALEQAQEAAFEQFKTEVNTDIADVREAADKVNTLDESIALCQESAANAEAQAQIVAEKAEEILNVKDELEAEINIKANVDLSNLSSLGQSKFDLKANKVDVLTKTQITNCLTEIPQNIKLDLTNGVLTLKAGSKVIVPNGFEADGTTPKFDEIVVESDIVIPQATGITNTVFMACVSIKDGIASGIERINSWESGNGSSYAKTWELYYNTATNKCYTVNSSANSGNTLSLPIALIKNDTSGLYVSINQTFNGIGYIGSTFWIDKGVKGLYPNGRNEDGSLKNIEFTTSTVLTYQASANANNIPIRLNGNTIGVGFLLYDNEKNINYITSSGVNSKRTLALVGTVSADSNGLITSLNPKTSFRAVDYNDFDTLNKNALLDSDKSEITSWGFPSNIYKDFTLGASGATYTAPADGWLYFSKYSNAAAQYINIGWSSSNLQINNYAAASGQQLKLLAPFRKGEQMRTDYNAGGNTSSLRFFYAKGAE